MLFQEKRSAHASEVHTASISHATSASVGSGTQNTTRGLFRENRSLVAMFIRIMDCVLIGLPLLLLTVASQRQWNDHYSLALACATGLFLLLAQSQEVYRSWRGAPLRQEVFQVFLAWTGVVVCMTVIAFVAKGTAKYDKQLIMAWFAVTPVLLALWRSGMYVAVGNLRRAGFNTRRVAIVGARDLGVKLADTLGNAPWMGMQVQGFYDDRRPAGSRPLSTKDYKVLGNLDTVVSRAKAGEIDTVYITLPLRAEQRIQELIAKLADTTVSVYLVPDFFTYSLMQTTWSSVGDLPTVAIHETPFYGVDGWVKRIEDVVLGSLILTAIAIPMLVIAMGVRMSSPGPVFFKQRRYGLQGQEIYVWKFRSMSVCEDGGKVTQATKNDSRITPFGGFLRRTSLDELPQFINVLQGTMSVVGPRPHAVAHNEEYRKIINGYMLRHKVKPGITGWAQVNGWRGETEDVEKMRARVEHDLAYIRDWSLWLDLKIVFLTFFKGFVGKNAY